MSDLVSIIVPAYNASLVIGRCIDSILSQTYKNIEIIVVDDGSTDGTPKLLEDKYLNNIKLYKRKNQGVSSSRNFGISVSTGSYIMFVDSDDVLDRTAVERVMDCAKRNRVDIVRFSYVEKYADSKKVIGMGDASNKVIDCSKEDELQSLTNLFFGENARMKCLVMTLLIKKAFLVRNNLLFDPDLYMMEDVVFYADIFKKGKKVYLLNEPLYVYYQNLGSVSHDIKKTKRIIKGVLDANEQMEKRFPGNTSINNKHFRIIMDFMSKNYKQCVSFVGSEKLLKLTRKTSFDKGSIYSLLRSSILNNNKLLFRIIIMTKACKNRITNRRRMI